MSSRNIIICPKCHNIGRLHTYNTESNTYYVVYHGYRNGKPIRCYLGPEEYKYVTVVHDFELRGALDSKRYTDYLIFIFEVLSERIRDNVKGSDEIARNLAEAYTEITKMLVKMSSDQGIDDSIRDLISKTLDKSREVISRREVSEE